MNDKWQVVVSFLFVTTVKCAVGNVTASWCSESERAATCTFVYLDDLREKITMLEYVTERNER